MKLCKITFVVLLPLLMVNCANNTPALEPENDPANPDQFIRPGLFTGESGSFSVNKFLDRNINNKDRRRFITVTGSDVDVPAIDLDSFEEFERFKAWRRAQQEGSAEYQDWLDFQNFQKLKKENES